jgi:hypothetical protein
VENARAAADCAPSHHTPFLTGFSKMTNVALRCLCLAALLVAGITLTGCAGTRNNAQAADAAPAKRADMNTPF